jgi:hypothetical protein
MMVEKIGKYKNALNNIKALEEQEEALQDKLNELVEEQYLFKDNTFYYADEARILYKDIVEIKGKKDSLVGMAKRLKARRETRQKAKIKRKKQRK